jgi:hypothetical protein
MFVRVNKFVCVYVYVCICVYAFECMCVTSVHVHIYVFCVHLHKQDHPIHRYAHTKEVETVFVRAWSITLKCFLRGRFTPPLLRLCVPLTTQDKAPVHSYAHTKKEVEAAFGVPLLTHFSWFDPKSLASGSIAQVGVNTYVCARMCTRVCVCLCVCVCARARVGVRECECVCVCVCVCSKRPLLWIQARE